MRSVLECGVEAASALVTVSSRLILDSEAAVDEPVAIGRASDVPADAGGAVAFAEWLAAACSGVLGKRLRSVILHGSLVLGGYTPGMSDIDLLAIVDAPLSPRVSTALVDATLAELADAPCRVDLRVATASVAAAPPEVPPMELYVGRPAPRP